MHRIAAAVLAAAVVLPAAARADVVRLTDDAATRFVRGLKAELAAREQAKRELVSKEAAHRAALAAHPAKHAAWEAEQARWETCQRTEVDPATVRAKAGVNAAVGDPAAAEARAKGIALQMQAAAQAGDMAQVQALSQKLAELNQPILAAAEAGTEDLMASAEKCGQEPKEPAEPTPPQQPGSRFHDVGARAAGMSEGGYRHLEERLGWALTSDGGVDLEPKMGYVNAEITPFTPAEVKVLKARGRELVRAMGGVNGG